MRRLFVPALALLVLTYAMLAQAQRAAAVAQREERVELLHELGRRAPAAQRADRHRAPLRGRGRDLEHGVRDVQPAAQVDVRVVVLHAHVARRAHLLDEPLLEDERVASDSDPAREAALSELRRKLAAELGTLSREQASVVVLKDALGFSFAEISEQSGMPVGTAKCYAHRARAGLRVRLTDETAA